MKNKTIIIIIAVCLVVGAFIGVGITYSIMRFRDVPPTDIASTGDIDNIKIKYIKIFKDRIVWKTIATEPGQITTEVDKETICGKDKKNIISIGINPFYQEDFYLGYYGQYQRIFLNKFVLGIGINFNQNMSSKVLEGYGATLGLGYMF